MAECTEHTSITVAGAGLASVNGTYVAAGTDTIGDVTFTVFSKDGNVNSVPRLVVRRDNPVSNQYGWTFFANIPVFGNSDIYDIVFVPAANLSDCPVGLTFKTTGGPWGSSTYLPVPTVTAGAGAPSQNTFGLPADVVTLITSRFGSVANFLRLRNQGQV